MPELCMRGRDEQLTDANYFLKKFYDIEPLAQTHGYSKEGTNHGISAGKYNTSHKALRQKWHQTVMKMMSRNELENMIGRAHLKSESSYNHNRLAKQKITILVRLFRI